MEVIGKKSNELAGKGGMEVLSYIKLRRAWLMICLQAFWPTDLAKECDKAARILHVFTSNEGLGLAEGSKPVSNDDLKKTQKVIKKIPPSAIKQAKGD